MKIFGEAFLAYIPGILMSSCRGTFVERCYLVTGFGARVELVELFACFFVFVSFFMFGRWRGLNGVP